MADGTAVGTIYLDLQIRDTLNLQLQQAADKAQGNAGAAFSEVGKNLGETLQKGFADTQQSLAATVNGTFSKSAALAQAKVHELERDFQRVSEQLDAAMSGVAQGEEAGKAVDALAMQKDKLYDRIETARERLAIEVQSAAEKQAAAEKAAAEKAAAAAEKAAARQLAAAQQAHTALLETRKINTENALRSPDTGGALPQGDDILAGWQSRLQAFSEAVTGSFAGAASQSQSYADKLQIGWLSALGRIGSSIKGTLGGAITRIGQLGKTAFGFLGSGIENVLAKLTPAEKTLGRFGTRLNGIVSGALIFNGISSALRSLTSYLGTTLTGTTQVQSALANLQGAAATAAAPLVQALAPALAAIANAAATAFSYISRLISFFTGKSVSSAAAAAKSLSSVGSAASNTAKQVKETSRSLAGFDEIEQMDKQSAGDDSAGGGAGSLLPNYDFTGTSPFLDSILDAIKAGDWEQAGALVAEKFNDAMASIDWAPIDATVSGWASNIARALNGFVEALDWGLLGTTLANGLNVGLHAVDTFFQTFDWSMLGIGLGDGLNGLFSALDWESLGRVLTDKLRAMLETLHGFLLVFDWTALGTDVATACMASFRNVDWVQAAGDLSTAAAGILAALTAWVQGIDWTQLGTTAVDCLLAIDWSGLLLSLLDFIGTTLLSLGAFLVAIWEELGNQVSNGLLDGILQGLRDIGGWLKTNLVDPLINNVKDFLGIHSPSTVFAEIGAYLVEGLLNGLADTWHTITDFLGTKLNGLKQTFQDVWSSIWQSTDASWSRIGAGIRDVWNAITETVKGAVNSVIGFMNKLLSGAADMVNGLIDILNKFHIDVPENVPLIGGTSFGFSLEHVPSPQIPMLANGGVITQPTLAMMGEYAGAHGNPEIAAPQDLLRETVASALSDCDDTVLACCEEVLAVLREILDAIYNLHLTDEEIGNAFNRFRREQAVLYGGNAL